MSIDVPSPGLDALAALLKATPKFLDAFYIALKNSKPRLRWGDIESKLVSELSRFPEAQRETIRSVLRMLNGVMYAEEGDPASEMVAALVQSARSKNDPRLDVSDNSWKHVRSFLEKTFALEQLQTASKALSLFSDTARHMHGARLLTDARPMYSNDPDEGPIGFVIIHTLRLDYYENGRTKDWYLALDSDDLETLKDIVDRAISKENSLKKCLKKTEIEVFTYRDEPDGHYSQET
jgi:hypothetical protein